MPARAGEPDVGERQPPRGRLVTVATAVLAAVTARGAAARRLGARATGRTTTSTETRCGTHDGARGREPTYARVAVDAAAAVVTDRRGDDRPAVLAHERLAVLVVAHGRLRDVHEAAVRFKRTERSAFASGESRRLQRRACSASPALSQSTWMPSDLRKTAKGSCMWSSNRGFVDTPRRGCAHGNSQAPDDIDALAQHDDVRPPRFQGGRGIHWEDQVPAWRGRPIPTPCPRRTCGARAKALVGG